MGNICRANVSRTLIVRLSQYIVFISVKTKFTLDEAYLHNSQPLTITCREYVCLLYCIIAADTMQASLLSMLTIMVCRSGAMILL